MKIEKINHDRLSNILLTYPINRIKNWKVLFENIEFEIENKQYIISFSDRDTMNYFNRMYYYLLQKTTPIEFEKFENSLLESRILSDIRSILHLKIDYLHSSVIEYSEEDTIKELKCDYRIFKEMITSEYCFKDLKADEKIKSVDTGLGKELYLRSEICLTIPKSDIEDIIKIMRKLQTVRISFYYLNKWECLTLETDDFSFEYKDKKTSKNINFIFEYNNK